MDAKVKILSALVAAGLLVGGVVLFVQSRSHVAVGATLRITVTPSEQLNFVMEQANSAKLKYLAGKQAGLSPAVAQKAITKPVPNTSILEVRIDVKTKEEARRYAGEFIQALQFLCAGQAQVALAEQNLR